MTNPIGDEMTKLARQLLEVGLGPISHADLYMRETSEIAHIIFASMAEEIESMVRELVKLRERKGRLFFIGLGGSAANCSHAVNDFRKLCGIEAYAPTDNVAELTARANDEGWASIFSNRWFDMDNDAIFILSVGGGTDKVSVPLSRPLAATFSSQIFGIVGRDGGYTKRHGAHVIIVPTIEPSRVTPHTEAFQSVILHCLVSHPDLQVVATKW